MIGVIIVAYQSADVIGACVRSLLASEGADLRIIVVDNGCTDATAKVVAAAADGADFADLPAERAEHLALADIAKVTLLRSPVNLGYAGACNIGLKALMPHAAVNLFWILNPDCVVMPDTAAAYVRCGAQAGAFGLMGGRTLYHDPPHHVQSDGGRLRRLTGIAVNVNAGALPDAVTMPDAATLDFISGANMVASRAFIEQVGLMAEDYFLYYEELDWAARRGALPFRLCPDAIVHHHGGTTIGTGTLVRAPSPFANYFNYRNRMRFMRRFAPAFVPCSWLWSLAAIGKMLLKGGGWPAAAAALRGLHELPPPPEVRARLAPAAAALAFGR
ncbi:MAG: glycosyltransferase family 2 protein [Sandarakinorhabdus sp.]|jgi:hypothetical protein|nr:glycosyltransferase family 2 protein [Sandarakinorhabdus sp.]